ncbi:hypothetical protein BDV36DRAFT_306148 [Aspergillus pseudocaelatus]|uniref:Phosphatidylglycerol lysyltransferase C-terminal domain-containing protein n=1 Tax=Aspergillus pseudocaelatus TaxID=1825620 RepID=A0ABQ6X2S9_9EURO|nr:hypothetical protein BDV36DRAFT_306148 [Aspergillus pseudocaelatus]
MSILDVSYRFFLNKARTGAVVYKLQTGVAVVCGDPLCEWTEIASVMNEFANFRPRNHLDIAFMGASDAFAKGYAQCKGWTMIEFGTQRALNPQTNTVLLGQAGKRIASQSRQLLNAQKGGIVLGVYTPAVHGTDLQLQASLVAIYEAWRAERNASAGLQAFITVYDLFALPELMTFIYAQSSGGLITGFAAIRQLGDGGYHLDPCIVAPGSPNGMTDLLVVAAMTLLRRAGVSSLGLGIEPSQSLSMENIVGIPGPVAKMARKLYDQTIPHLPIHGKKAYHDKFRPDSSKTSALYLIFPSSVFGLRYLLAMIHLANIGLRKLLLADFKARVSTGKSKSVVGHT